MKKSASSTNDKANVDLHVWALVGSDERGECLDNHRCIYEAVVNGTLGELLEQNSWSKVHGPTKTACLFVSNSLAWVL